MVIIKEELGFSVVKGSPSGRGLGVHSIAALERQRRMVGVVGRKKLSSFQHPSMTSHTGSVRPII